MNSSSPRALILPPMKTLQVGHIHRARSAPSSSSSWSHLSVSAIISFRAPAWVGPASPVCEGTPCRPGTAVRGGWGQRTERRSISVRWQRLVMPAQAYWGEKMQAGFPRPALNWVSVAARPPVPPPPAAARRRVQGPRTITPPAALSPSPLIGCVPPLRRTQRPHHDRHRIFGT